ncbi:cobalt ECF transporter T component CbiQ [Nodosilinea nodulosa]|uniref:cobalt ECF transporter T component CbiQ n=1 Tax=Nodosilinea nodulosa TaxID=416001 RepID=UPI003BF59FF9
MLHIGGFHLAVDSDRSTPWHRLVPQTRLLCALVFVFATALTPTGHWETWALYALGLAVLIGLSRVSLPVLLLRVALEAGFVGVVLIGTLFRPGGTVLWQWGMLQVTTEGLAVLGSVSFKALLCLIMLNLLTLTTPVPELLQGLTRLKMPPLLVAILASMYRYIAVLAAEFSTMRRAAASRNLTARPQGQRRVIGNMIGALFVRSYVRGDRVYQAMLARGYSGAMPTAAAIRMGPPDRIALGLMVGLAAMGQLLWFGV